MFILFVLFTLAAGACTYVQYDTDAAKWGGGSCWVDNTTIFGCSDVGRCIQYECYCPGDRGAPNCQYRRFDKDVQGTLGIVLGLGGVGFINEFIVRNFAFAFGQLITSLVGGLMIFIALRLAKEDKHKFCMLFFGICIILVACIWSVIDGILILTCSVKDGNGYSYSV
jgi:hypothetical protein